MAGASKPPPKLPTVSVVVPRRPSSGVPSKVLDNSNSSVNAQNVTPKPAAAPKPVIPEPSAIKPEVKPVVDIVSLETTMAAPTATTATKTMTTTEVSESEMQLVSSLAKLQKMEAMIHQLRNLLPERLLDPILPIVNPKAAAGRQIPRSPQVLNEQLSQAARSGVAEVNDFQSMWRSPEMKATWERVDAQIKENGGQLLQPTGVWERDYDVILEELVKEEERKKEQQQRADEELERSRIQSTEGGWRGIVESFAQRNVPGVRVLPGKNEASITVALTKAGIVFKVHTAGGLDANNAPEWQVSNRTVAPGQHPTKLEMAVANCLNSRPRKWDLAHLLDMISTYSNIKQAPCAKCNKMTDSATQLPTIRQHKLTPPSDGQQQQPPSSTWEAYHPSCI